MFSLVLGSNDRGVPDEWGELETDKEVAIESNPLTNLMNGNAGALRAKDEHAVSIDGSDGQHYNAQIDSGASWCGELVAVSRNEIHESIYVNDLTAGEELCSKHVVLHVIIAVKEANAWPEDEANKRGEQKDIVC